MEGSPDVLWAVPLPPTIVGALVMSVTGASCLFVSSTSTITKMPLADGAVRTSVTV